MTANTSTLLKSGFILLRLMRVNSAEFSSFVVAERDKASSRVECALTRKPDILITTSSHKNLLPKCVATRKGLAAGAHRPFLEVRKSCLRQRRRGENVVAAPGPLVPGAIRRCGLIVHKLREERRAY